MAGLLIWREKQNQHLVHELMKALLAENLTDFTSSTIIEDEQKAAKKSEDSKTIPVNFESIDAAEFDKHIKAVNE
jgi:hypothetical protein